MFTGDASGAFLFPALHRAGLASRPDGSEPHDGMTLHGVWITAALRCVPPGNKPRRDELTNCRRWLRHDLTRLPRLRAVVALGRIAHDSYLDLLRAQGAPIVKAHHRFAHGAEHRLEDGLPLIDAYHVSFQNTNTGRLTPAMFDAVLARAKELGGW